MKYNYYMRYKNNENIELIFNEIKENPNSNFGNVNQFINALNFWGPEFKQKKELSKERTLKYIW